MPTLCMARDFLWEFGKLEKPVQKQVHDVFAKFEQATFAGVHLESIDNVRDARLRSIRIDRFWRGVVLAPESGDSYILLRVLPHDEAYRWARRQTASVNRAIGAIELRDTVAIDEAIQETSPQNRDPATSRLLSDVSDADLERLGVDQQIIALARTLTSTEQLDATRGILPEPQFDVLMGLASGYSPEEVWAQVAETITEPGGFDPEDLTAAIDRSPRQVVRVSGPDELMEMFSYPFDLWRIYLHPVQQRAAYSDYSGPARVTGGPGTGKTVAVLHRAAHLAEQAMEDGSLLVTTFTRTLNGSLEDQLRKLVDDEDVLRRVDVRNVDQLANRVVTARHGKTAILSGDEERALWSDVVDRTGVALTEAFLAQEWRDVVLAHELSDLAGYQEAPRRGRGRQLGRRQREEAWSAMSAFAEELTRRGLWTYETVCVAATRLLAERQDKPYRHIVVDEAQDLAPWHWRMLRAAVPAGADDMFLASDTNQRIYHHRVSLKQVGVHIAGRSEKLKLNYRTTAEILSWSLGLLHGQHIDDMDGDLETLAGCRSDVHGTRPSLLGSPTRQDEFAALAADIRGWLDDGVEPDQIGIAARSGALVDAAVNALTAAGLPAVSLARTSARADRITVGTMHRMKGLEFRCVAVIGLSEHQVPPPSAITPSEEDPVTHELQLQQERCLLFVACTRAREALRVSWYGTPSRLLPGPASGHADGITQCGS